MSNCCNAKVIDPSGEGIEGVCADCGEHCGVVGDPTNEQELEQILEGLYHAGHTDGLNDVFRPKPRVKRYKQLITAHTNAEIARTLDRIASKKNIYVKHAEYVTELNEPPLVITTDYKYMIDLGAIQAERAKLKEQSDE